MTAPDYGTLRPASPKTYEDPYYMTNIEGGCGGRRQSLHVFFASSRISFFSSNPRMLHMSSPKYVVTMSHPRETMGSPLFGSVWTSYPSGRTETTCTYMHVNRPHQLISNTCSSPLSTKGPETAPDANRCKSHVINPTHRLLSKNITRAQGIPGSSLPESMPPNPQPHIHGIDENLP